MGGILSGILQTNCTRDMFSEEEKIDCPYCGETITILVDTSVPEQDYIEDCQVCCQPIEFNVLVTQTGEFQLNAKHQDEC